MDQRIAAIRANEMVGHGSCTSIDECYSDDELIVELDADGITAPSEAVKWAIELEGLRIENATNYRWGEDDDPEIRRLKEWKARLEDK
jgi:hypothetical protein